MRRTPAAILTTWGFPIGCSSLVFLGTGAFLIAGLLDYVLYAWTGDSRWIKMFFAIPGALALVWLSATSLAFSLIALRGFAPGQSMRNAWVLISLSAGFDLAAAITVQIFAKTSPLNPLIHFPWWSSAVAANIRQCGVILGGTCRLSLLAVGLGWARRTYRTLGVVSGSLSLGDRAVLAIAAVCIALEVREVVVFLASGWRPPVSWVLGWPTDPLLWLLLLQALRLHRAVQQSGAGLIGRSWRAFSVGVFLVSLGDLAQLVNRYLFPGAWSVVTWYIWLPAAAAFALAPLYQLEAMHYAQCGPRLS